MIRGPSTGARDGAAGRIRVACVLALCAIGVGSCGSSGGSSTAKYLDMARVTHAIERSILSERGLKSTVVCPAKVPQKPGKFACIATTHAKKKPHRKIKTPFVVTVHNDQGYVTYVGR